jgi:hypothetical protein
VDLHVTPQAAPGMSASEQAFGALNETDQMKLQLDMERKSKAAETASNLMKSMSQTEDSITDNIK